MKQRTTLTKLFLIVLIFALPNCSSNNNHNKYNNNTNTSKVEVEQKKQPEKKTYSIKGEDIFLREGPGKKYNKLVNKKATKIIGETQYLQVDYTCTVSIEKEENGWAKIRVVDPSYLSSSHYGWIPLKNIVKEDEKIEKVDLSKLKYDVISISENKISKNYNVYLDINKLTKDDISSFIKQFRKQNCSSCTINVFDTKKIKKLIGVYPKRNADYIEFADHLVASSPFGAPKVVAFYPLQDSYYKKIGGKNFKKDKLKQEN